MESGAADFMTKQDFKPDPFARTTDYAIRTANERNQLLARTKKTPG